MTVAFPAVVFIGTIAALQVRLPAMPRAQLNAYILAQGAASRAAVPVMALAQATACVVLYSVFAFWGLESSLGCAAFRAHIGLSIVVVLIHVRAVHSHADLQPRLTTLPIRSWASARC